MKTKLESLLINYRAATIAIEDFKAKHFRPGTTVFVDCLRYKGSGIVVTDSTRWPDYVAVNLPNGNTWQFPLEAVRTIKKGKQ